MTKVNVTKSIQVPASSAWEKLASFRGIEAFSPIERSITTGEGPGAKRTCYMPDGAAIYETLNSLEAQDMEMQYSITEGPFPITGYVSNIKVSRIDPNNCNISWGCSFESSEEVNKEMISLFEGFYNTIIDRLETVIKEHN